MRTLQCEQKSEKRSSCFLTKSIKNYIVGLLICIGKKNCSSMAAALGGSYHSVYGGFRDFESRKKDMQNYFINLVNIYATEENPGFFIVDTTQIKKIYGKSVKNLCYDFSGSMKQVLKGMSCVTAAWSNGKIVIPLDFDFWVRKKELKNNKKYRKKTEISKELILKLKDKIPFAFILLDGDYGNEGFLRFLYQINLKYFLRMPSNRKVVINGIEVNLKNHPALKLIRNKRYKKMQGFYKGIPVIITTQKRKGKNNTKQVVFVVSNMQGLSAKEHIETYACRWPIEKMFRTMKQSLGLENCQCVSVEKNRAHIFFVFLAFLEGETEKITKRKKSTEQGIKSIRSQILSKINPGFEHWKGFFM